MNVLNDTLFHGASFAAGGLIGLFYHAGLWWTVTVLPRFRRPVALSIASFYVRTGIVMAVFYVVVQNGWIRLVLCMTGFMAVKFVMTRFMGIASASLPGKRDRRHRNEYKS